MQYFNTHTKDILEHKAAVGDNMIKVSSTLARRAVIHDNSKFSKAEFESYSEAVPKLIDLTYGTPEHRVVLDSIRPAIEHHKAHNSHHPEYHQAGINDMDVLDLIEMVCDWKAAIGRNPETDVRKAVESNCEKFDMSNYQTFLVLSILDILE